MDTSQGRAFSQTPDKARNVEAPQSRVLPHNLDAEQSLLGGVLLRNDALHQVLEIIDNPNEFYHPAHQLIFSAMVELFERGSPIDPITLEEQLKSQDRLQRAGGLTYINDLQMKVPTSENIAFYARIVRDKATVRQIILTTTEITAKGYGDVGEVDDFIDESEKRLFEISQRAQKQSFHPIKKVLQETFKDLEKR